MILCDQSAERAVLSGILHYGEDAFLDVTDIITESSFTIDSNQIIYRCLKNTCEKNSKPKIDIATVYSSAQELDLGHILNKKDEAQHLRAIFDFPVNLENVRKFAAKIRKLEIARSLHKELDEVKDKLLDINGSEPISSILGLAEDSIFSFASKISNDNESAPSLMGEGIEEYIEYLQENIVDQIGIPTGFHAYDQSIGGGLRKGTVNVIGARPKTGKTLLSDNMGRNIAKLGIPVLNMDTEMSKKDHIHRLLAMASEIEISKIETGRFSESPNIKSKVIAAAQELKNLPIHHKVIAGKPFDEQLSIMRRWLVKEVGLNDDGTAKDCVIFYAT